MSTSETRRWLAARARELYRGESSGQAILEFALVSPLIMMLLLGTVIFGIGLNEDLQLTNATQTAAQQLSVSRGSTYPSTYSVTVSGKTTTEPYPTVCQTAEQAFVNSAPNLNPANLTFTLLVAGQSSINTTKGASTFGNLSSSSGCPDALTANQNLTLTVTYPFRASFLNFGTYTLSSTVQEVIE